MRSNTLITQDLIDTLITAKVSIKDKINLGGAKTDFLKEKGETNLLTIDEGQFIIVSDIIKRLSGLIRNLEATLDEE